MSGQHWLTGEVLDEDTAPWILGINKSYFMLGLKSGGRAGLKGGGKVKGCGKALRGYGKAMKGKR